MKIVDMRLTPIAMADPPLLSSYGLHAPYALRTVVELVSEDGLTGAAETHGGDGPLGDLERARPMVVGRDAFDLSRLWLAVGSQPFGAWTRRLSGAPLVFPLRPTSFPARVGWMRRCVSLPPSRLRRWT
jgi:glucarate dehydratase